MSRIFEGMADQITDLEAENKQLRDLVGRLVDKLDISCAVISILTPDDKQPNTSVESGLLLIAEARKVLRTEQETGGGE